MKSNKYLSKTKVIYGLSEDEILRRDYRKEISSYNNPRLFSACSAYVRLWNPTKSEIDIHNADLRSHIILIHQEIRNRGLLLPEGEEWMDVWEIESVMEK